MKKLKTVIDTASFFKGQAPKMLAHVRNSFLGHKTRQIETLTFLPELEALWRDDTKLVVRRNAENNPKLAR